MRKTLPLRGEIRIVRRFLWLPLILCVDKYHTRYEWRWLEFADIKQTYFFRTYDRGWEDQGFVNARHLTE